MGLFVFSDGPSLFLWNPLDLNSSFKIINQQLTIRMEGAIIDWIMAVIETVDTFNVKSYHPIANMLCPSIITINILLLHYLIKLLIIDLLMLQYPRYQYRQLYILHILNHHINAVLLISSQQKECSCRHVVFFIHQSISIFVSCFAPPFLWKVICQKLTYFLRRLIMILLFEQQLENILFL